MTQPIAVIGATFFELKPLLKKLKAKKIKARKQAHFFQADRHGKKIIIVRTGVGKKAAQKGVKELIKQHNPSLVFSVGLCGAVTPELKISDPVFPSQLIDFETGKIFDLQPSPFCDFQKGRMATVEKIFGPEEKKMLLEKYPGVLACEMESSALAEACLQQQVPFWVLRHVSDKADYRFIPEHILLEKNLCKQLKFLFQHSGWFFPMEFGRLILLGIRSRKSVLANTKLAIKFLLNFVDNPYH